MLNVYNVLLCLFSTFIYVTIYLEIDLAISIYVTLICI